MGVSESKLFAEKMAEVAGRGGSLGELYHSDQLPPEWKLYLDRVGLQITPKRQTQAILKFQSIKESDLGMPLELQLHLTGWRELLPAFFAELVLEDGKVNSRTIYTALSKLTNLTVKEEVQQRILAVALYELCESNEFPISEFALDVQDQDDAKVEKQIRRFINFGHKLSDLCDAPRSYGTLLVIPTGVLTWLRWANDINHKQIPEAIRHLASINVSKTIRGSNSQQVAISLIDWIKSLIRNWRSNKSKECPILGLDVDVPEIARTFGNYSPFYDFEAWKRNLSGRIG
ncbi:MAG: hypothetical protein M1814_000902 [Vezdaea aestivalis]|nr:MAG: hypothetical protein M1814_000902 [Vezdaea aestivalis]